MSEQSAVQFIDEIAPSHDRTSCDDENLYNAAYGPEDRGGYGRCRRCGLLDIVRRTIAEDEDHRQAQQREGDDHVPA